jgi:predicted NBD/HSP70 family sugar kinase
MKSFLILQTGFGLGMFLNGKLYRGHQHHAGEMGLMQLRETGEPSVDGRVGTLGSIAPFYKLTDRIEDIIEKGGNTAVSKYLPENEKKVSVEMVVKAIEDGDQLCAQMMSELFETIAKAIVNLAYIFNPEAIFLPRWTKRCREVSLDVVRRQMGHYGVSNWELKTEILSSKCGAEHLAKGASLLPVEKMFKGDLI